ncbi:MAG TPA: hypothetical protein VMU43_00320 [Candidatus Acidoferrum sp.]|nr:hypothetical protein [Candidatus Acidoferrum sp.]
MSKEILMQFVGFESKPGGREYTFTVREAASDTREFTLMIASEAFLSRKINYQDGPDVCSLKLRRELAKNDNHPQGTHYQVTDADLEDYRSSHMPPSKRPFARKPIQEF